jgi:hypothetical protein
MSQGELPFEYTVCIDGLLGPKLKAMGIKCPCAKCSSGGPEDDVTENGEHGTDEDETLLDRPPGPRRIPPDAIRDGEEKKQD